MRNSIVLIIPAYNEELTIADCILGFNETGVFSKIYVVNNASTDRTSSIAKKVFAENNIPGGVLFEGKKGKASAVKHAFENIDADNYVLVDADLTYDPKDLTKLLAKFEEEQADMVVGDRLSSGGYAKQNVRMFHNWGNNFVKNLINYLFKAQLRDVMSGYRVFSSKFVRSYPALCHGFEIETDMSIHALDKGFKIVEVPVSYYPRPENSESKLNTYSDGVKIVNKIIFLMKDYKPLTFFGICGLGLFALGFITGIPAIMDYALNRYVEHVPLAILATGLMILATILLGVGLILDTVVFHQKLSYELLTRKNKSALKFNSISENDPAVASVTAGEQDNRQQQWHD